MLYGPAKDCGNDNVPVATGSVAEDEESLPEELGDGPHGGEREEAAVQLPHVGRAARLLHSARPRRRSTLF